MRFCCQLFKNTAGHLQIKDTLFTQHRILKWDTTMVSQTPNLNKPNYQTFKLFWRLGFWLTMVVPHFNFLCFYVNVSLMFNVQPIFVLSYKMDNMRCVSYLLKTHFHTVHSPHNTHRGLGLQQHEMKCCGKCFLFGVLPTPKH